MARVKRGRARIRSQASNDKRPNNQMSMARTTTRERYEANDIARAPVSQAAKREANAVAVKAQQATLKPVRSSQATDLNKAK